MTHPIRPATPADIPALTEIWYQGWHEAHAADVPAALTALRTRDDFTRRLIGLDAGLRAGGPDGAPLGFVALKPDEINQLYVAPPARGTGLAAALMADAEARLAAGGTPIARLDCGLGNHAAARFYARQGWREEGVIEVMLDTSDGPFPLPVRRFTKRLSQ